MKRRRTAHRTAAVLSTVVLVAGAAACNGDDDVASTVPDIAIPSTTEDTFFDTTTTEPVETTEPTVATTTAPPTTTSPTTTAPQTTSPETTDAPPSTVADPEVQAVIDAMNASGAAFIAVFRDPFNDDLVDEVRRTHGGELLPRVLTIIEDFRLQDLRTIENPSLEARIVALPSTVRVDGQVAEIEYCYLNSEPTVEVGGATDGSDLIVDDAVVATVELAEMELVDGAWKHVGGEGLRVLEELTCDIS